MIFVSHNSKDKDFIGPMAQSLKESYGEENVFFDSWSIKPGENIIQRMNEGLEKCKYFFFFITENSLNSEMVTLEWTSTLKERGRRDIQFIPIKADDIEVPLIISALNYLDITTSGLDMVLTQMYDLINREERSINFPAYKNVKAYALAENENTVRFFIYAKRFFEPSGKFLFVTNLEENDVKLEYLSSSIIQHSYNPKSATLNEKEHLNSFMIGTEHGIKVGFKVEILFEQLSGKLKLLNLYHIKGEDKFEMIPVTQINSIDELNVN
ncbi:hypothetical protein J2Z23_004161 [Lederbergia galactosidilyticus]|uniref:toll/interleukin-1 receptor domain-containing protein n=1 Tax=Lederbergia galactosidilytica TaxID=217031 RepID=UPI001AE8130C|nr:toll/interleukin-1 receptor domain-containing protein [Lederbergia galactosidilytica]MBP1917176.1 hypothetical protein [Lederbergia galactosidilytica]